MQKSVLLSSTGMYILAVKENEPSKMQKFSSWSKYHCVEKDLDGKEVAGVSLQGRGGSWIQIRYIMES